MANRIPRVPVREQDPAVRAHNFEEVCYGYDKEEALLEASRCLHCKNPRCVSACPVGLNIPEFIAKLAAGDISAAAGVIAQDSSLPAVCGRVCPQETQCEGSCILGVLHKAGGVLEYGIPEFRLPKEKVLKHEIEDVLKLGVKIETDVIVGRTVTIDSLMDEMGFKAVFIGTGAGLPKFMGIPGENLCGVFSANEFLTRNNLMRAYRGDYLTPIHAGRKVCVVGGGNVAMDAARTALRLGAEVHIVYRRTEAELPARKEEVHHAKQEGIVFDLLTNPVEILDDGKGWVKSIKCIRMELGEADESGRRSPVPVPGSEFEIDADTVIMALGTSSNPLIAKTTAGLETTRRGCLVADEEGATTRPGVFAGGDAVTGAATVILAMGAGRTAARSIDAYIKNL